MCEGWRERPPKSEGGSSRVWLQQARQSAHLDEHRRHRHQRGVVSHVAGPGGETPTGPAPDNESWLRRSHGAGAADVRPSLSSVKPTLAKFRFTPPCDLWPSGAFGELSGWFWGQLPQGVCLRGGGSAGCSSAGFVRPEGRGRWKMLPPVGAQELGGNHFFGQLRGVSGGDSSRSSITLGASPTIT